MIQSEAVDAAMNALDPYWITDWIMDASREQLREMTSAILEAAAPHLLPIVTTMEELDALPHGSVIRSSHRHYWVAHKEDGEGGNQGWAAAGTSRIPTDLADWLPATVLHVGDTE